MPAPTEKSYKMNRCANRTQNRYWDMINYCNTNLTQTLRLGCVRFRWFTHRRTRGPNVDNNINSRIEL